MVEQVEPTLIFTSASPVATVYWQVEQATSNFVLADYEQLKNENKKLTGELEKLREEFKLMAEQLKSRDEYLQQTGAKMLSFCTTGTAGQWTKYKDNYLN